MADTWIVSSYNYSRHLALPVAERERDRLVWLEPDKRWRVYRVKTTLPPGNTKAVMEAADLLCKYIGTHLDSNSDPNMVALAAKLQYEIAIRSTLLKEEELAAMELYYAGSGESQDAACPSRVRV